jgi:hypothetical protein
MGNLGLSESLTTKAKLAADLAIIVAEGSPGNPRGALSHRKHASSPHAEPHMSGLFDETVDRLGCARLPRDRTRLVVTADGLSGDYTAGG